MDESACDWDDMAAFFPDGSKHQDATEAKRICAVCPVFLECQEFAESGKPPASGVWAGVDYRKKRDGTIWN